MLSVPLSLSPGGTRPDQAEEIEYLQKQLALLRHEKAEVDDAVSSLHERCRMEIQRRHPVKDLFSVEKKTKCLD
jgi:hypothetical protein